MFRNIFILPIIILVCFSAYAKNEECKTIVFENIGKCNGAGGDVILTEIPFQRPTIDFLNDSTYSTTNYGVQLKDADFTIIYQCTDSLDLDFLANVITNSLLKLKFIKTGLVTNDSYPKGSMQIRFYNSNGERMNSYYCIGHNKTKKLIRYLDKEVSENQQYVQWEFKGLLRYFTYLVRTEC
ncbi:MAG: hypothetical protein H6582_03610 [Crocinitomicaceae bacterium]|nr:hypothetical protein [Crocinitomicaceae bacterium]